MSESYIRYDRERRREIGLLPPQDEGIFKETLKAAGNTVLDLGRSFGSTLEETTGISGMREYFDDVKRTHRHWEGDPSYRPSSLKPSHVARTIATGVTQSVAAIGAGALGTLAAGPAVGAAAMGATTFAQLYGDTVKDYREAMEDESDELVKGMAFLSAAGQAAIETVLGPERVLAGIGKGFFSGALKQTTRSLAKRIGANAARGAIEEGSEEVCQLYWDTICKGVYAKKGIELPGWEEVKDNFMGGALPGAVLGGFTRQNRGTAVQPGTETAVNSQTVPAEAGTVVPQETPTQTAETVQPEQPVQPQPEQDRPLFDGREPVSMDEIENVPETAQVPVQTNGKDMVRFERYLNDRLKAGTLIATENDIRGIKKFYESFPLGKQITNRFGEEIIFAPMDAGKVDDYIQHFAVKRGGKVEKFSNKHIDLFRSLEEALKNPDERILTETKNGDRRICFVKRMNENGNHFVVTAISENGHLLAWTHMQPSNQYIETQRKNEKECFNKYGVVDRDGNRLEMTYDEYLQKKTDMPLYLATAQTNRESLSQMTIPDGNNTLQPETEKSSTGTENIAKNIPGRSLRADETGRKLAGAMAKALKLNLTLEQRREGDSGDVRGWYDSKDNSLHVYADTPVLEVFGHELKHYFDHKGIGTELSEFMLSNLNDAGRAELQKITERYQQQGVETNAAEELLADQFGRMLSDPEFLADTVRRAEAKQAGFGRHIAQLVLDFVKQMRKKLKLIGTKEAKEWFDHLGEIRDRAAELIADVAAGDSKYEIGNMKYEMGAEPGANAAVNGQETQKAETQRAKDEVKEPKPEAKVAEKAEMPKTEETATVKTPETEKSSEAAEKAEEKTGDPEVMSLDQFLASRGVAAPISDFMIDKLKIPHGLTARQEQQFHKEAEAARNAYHNKRDAAIEEYERLVAEGKIRKPTIIEEALRKAHGHPDNPSVQAARRVLKKRGIDWRTGEPLAESAEENKTPEATATPAAGNEKKAAPKRRRATVEENGEALDNAGRVQLLSSKPAGVNFKDAKVYLDRGSGYSRVRLAEKGNDLYALFTGQNFKNRYIKIADYQNTTPAEVIADIPNQGRNFEDALHDYYDAKGLNLGYAAPLNRMKMPASQSEAPAVKSAEQKFNEAKTFPARCHELIDLNDGSYTINGISFVKDGTLYQVDGLTEKVNARLLTQILGKAKNAAESVVKQNLTTDEGLAVLEEKIYQQEQKMDKLAKYATPASYDARKAEEYYKEKSELDKLRQQYNEMLDAAAAKRPESRPERRRFINDFGEATTREITTATYERAQKRQEQAVLRNMGVKFSLKREPLDVEDFRQMEAHERPEKVHFDSVKDLYHIYEQEYLGQTIRAVSGHNLTFKPGHFFRLIAGTPEGMRKGWIAKAKDAADAIAKIKAGKIDFSDIAGYQDFRAKNIKLFRDVVTNADFWYEENGKITYGKKYAGIKKADGFISVTLDLGNNELGILSFYPHRFTQSFLEGKKIHWHTAQPIERAIASDDVSSMAKSPEFEHTVIENPDNSSAESQKSGKFQENDGGTIKFSIRREEPPKKTRTGYKVFAMFKSHPGELFPPMVANPGGASTPVGVWLNADAAPRAEDSKTGRPRVQSGGKGTNAGKATLAYRPGWHLGPLPEASQFLVKNPETGEAKSMFPENFVFAECEFAADEDYQQEAMSYGYNASGKFQHSLAGLPKVPKDGYYVYRTNPDPKTVPWYISGAMRVKRLLNDRETAEILRENGSRMIPRRGGELDLKAWGFDRTDFTGTDGVKYSLARTEQRNPIEVEGEAKRENQEKLNKEEHEVHHDADVLNEAQAEIDAHGGIGKVIEKVLNGRKLFTPDDVGQRMGQLVMNSDEYGELSSAERSLVSDAVIQVGTQLGQALRARRSLTEAMMSDPDALKSTLRLITDRTPDADKTREHVKEETGVDPLNPPDNLNNDKDKLDQVMRELSAAGANLKDKIYEYWINAILSGPQTHAVNVIGNTANAAYELTAKRFAEACINLVAKKKDGATFGEFREMWKHLSFSEAWRRAVFAFNHEMVSYNGKYQENNGPAISGKTGRMVRLPSRLLNAADQFSRALIQPVETAAMAYREGVSKGLTGKALQDFMERQMLNPKSNAFKYGEGRAREMVFQEEPGAIVRYLIAMKNEPGIKGTVISFLFPFIKTPSNILRQGLRKSPLGALNLAGETLDVLRGKRGIDNRYIQHAAEQILAWSAFLMLKGFDSGDDEDDLPILTGSSATPGSGEALFKGQHLPAYSIRIGDTWYSYKRIEPLATGLTIIADAIQELKEVGKGKSATAALKKMLKGTTSMIAEKSYLDTLNQVNQLMNDPEREAANWSANFFASWMPAAVRQTVTAMDDTVRDFKMRSLGTDWYNDFFHTVTSRTGLTKRAPKVDYFGREIRKEFAEDSTAGDVVFRLLTGSGRKPAWDLEEEDRIIANWNLRNPGATWWPNIPNWKFKVNKRDYYFDTETYPEYARKAGELARKQVKRAIRNGYLNVENPREKDIELMKKILMRARKETRQKMFSLAREIR